MQTFHMKLMVSILMMATMARAEDPEPGSRNQLLISAPSNELTDGDLSSWLICIVKIFAMSFFKLLASLVWKIGTN